MKKLGFISVAVLLLALVGAASAEEAMPEKGALAGEINIVVGAGGEQAVIKSGIKVVFLTWVKGSPKDGPQDVDKPAPGQERVEATTGADGFYFIKGIDPAKHYQIRRITAEVNGKPATYNPVYHVSNPDGAKVVGGVAVFWHKLTLNYSPEDGVFGNQQATCKMSAENLGRVLGGE